jgi:hypothetical protein
MLYTAFIFLGLLVGLSYYYFFERFDTKSLPKKCYFVMHYLNKQFSPMYAVHLKSMLAGALLIWAAVYNYKKIIVFVGASIIGLHVSQFANELNVIRIMSKGER